MPLMIRIKHPGILHRLNVLGDEIGRRERIGQRTEADWIMKWPTKDNTRADKHKCRQRTTKRTGFEPNMVHGSIELKSSKNQ